MRIHPAPTLPTALLAIVAAVSLIACGDAPQPPSSGAGGTPQVSVMTVQPQRLALTTELPGRVAPALIAEVRPQITGLVQQRRFKEGSDVKAGDLLYQIDPATYRASVDNAKATLAKAEASLVTVKLKAGRYQELVAIKAVSQQDADDAAASLLQAQAEVTAAKAALQTQQINLDYTRVAAGDQRHGRDDGQQRRWQGGGGVDAHAVTPGLGEQQKIITVPNGSVLMAGL